MRYLSVCSGIEAATVAWHPLGWVPVAFAEIDGFCRQVLHHHYPDVPCHGDFVTMQGDEYGAIDLLVGGTPCQDFSVAGLRAGMDGKRGQLTVEFAHLAGRLRPRWLVWENVPGVLSIEGGRAFGTFLGLLGQLGYGVAYRVLDAQHFGVPQRRRRVFVVGYLGDWRRAAAVLFERHSLSGHPPPSRKAGQVAPTIPSRSSGGGGLGTDFDRDGGLIQGDWPAEVAPTLNAHFGEKQGLEDQHIRGGAGLFVYGRDSALPERGGGGMGRQDFETETLLAIGGFPSSVSADVAPTLRAGGNSTGGDRPPGTDVDTCESLIVTHALRGEGFDASEDGTGRGTPLIPVGITIHETDGTTSVASFTETASSLRSRVPGCVENSTTTAVLSAVAFAQNSRDEVRLFGGDGDTVGALAAEPGMKQTTYVATLGHTKSNGLGVTETETANTLEAVSNANQAVAVAFQESQSGTRLVDSHATLGANDGPRRMNGVISGRAVRRLTPRECERLQGFPDDYTKISDKTADGSRYKALGNSMAVPVMRWIGERIAAVEALSSR